jgi:serine/threonine protein kinase
MASQGNILIGDDLHPLLCDFGISRLENENEAKSTIPSSNLAGSVRWMAIEVIQDQMYGSAPLGKRCNTVASDVWSYGMVLYVGSLNLSNYKNYEAE